MGMALKMGLSGLRKKCLSGVAEMKFVVSLPPGKSYTTSSLPTPPGPEGSKGKRS